MSTLSLEDVTLNTTIREIEDANLDWDEVYELLNLKSINDIGVSDEVILDTFTNLHGIECFKNNTIYGTLRRAKEDCIGCYDSVEQYVLQTESLELPGWLENAINWNIVEENLQHHFCVSRIDCGFGYIVFAN